MEKIKILFVCTGNIFRSMSAEYCLRKYIGENEDIEVSSAGTVARVQVPDSGIAEKLGELGIDPSKHKINKLTEKHFEEFDLVVAMSKDHKEFIKENFDLDVPLFNEICYNKPDPLKDVWEILPDSEEKPVEKRKCIREIIGYINDSIPLFVKNYNKWI